MRNESKHHYFMRELYTETGKLVTYLYDNIPEALHKNNTSDKSMMDSSFSITVDFVSIHKSYDLDDYRLIVNCELDMGEEHYKMKCDIPYKLLGKSHEEIDEYFREYYERQKKKQEEYEARELIRKKRNYLLCKAEGIDDGYVEEPQFHVCRYKDRESSCYNSYICKDGTVVCLLNNVGIVTGTNNDILTCKDYTF